MTPPVGDANSNVARERYLFGSYEILETTGTGGMAIVYRAIDLALGRTVAVKVLRDDLRTRPSIVARFKREAQAFATLSHPNIVHIYSVGSIANIPYLAMEYIEGRTLSRILIDDGPLDWQRTLDIGAQVASALVCAHDAQIIHRDIKPGNIIIDGDGKAYVTDFGIAKVLTAATQLTLDGARLGTPQYMSPERCRDKEITPASDIYSLGVLMFQCISLRLPHEAPSSAELIQKIAVEPATRLGTLAPGLPEPVERLIAYMLEKDPAHRPKDARVLCAAIERVRQGLPLDEHADELASAIASFRDALPASATRKAVRKKPAKPVERPDLLTRLKRCWSSPGARLTLLASAVSLAVLAFGAVQFASPASSSLYDIAASPPHDIERWYDTAPLAASAPLAAFLDEAPNVVLAHLNMPDFKVTHIFRGGAPATILVQLDGATGTPREGQRALCTLDVDARMAAVAIPPTHTRHAGDFAVLAGGIRSKRGPGYYVATRDATVFASLAPTHDPAAIAQYRAAAIALHPRDAGLAMAYTTGGRNDWVVAETTPGAAHRMTPRTRPGAPIAAAAYSPDGGLLAYVREPMDGGRELWIANCTGTEETGARLCQGALSLPAHPFSPDGGSLVVARTDEGGQSSLHLIATRPGAQLADLGQGHDATWHPSGAYIIAAGAQLWAVQHQAPHRREQLTHLQTGLVPAVTMSEDGRYAVAPIPDCPAIAIVTLD